MLMPKSPRNPLNNLPFFVDAEDPYPFQTYMFQVFRNLAVAQATQVESMSKEILSWVMQEWCAAMTTAVAQPAQKAKDNATCTIVIPRELLEFTLRLLLELKNAKRKQIDLLPETQELYDELKENGLTPKSPVSREELNALEESEIYDVVTPSKERKKKPLL